MEPPHPPVWKAWRLEKRSRGLEGLKKKQGRQVADKRWFQTERMKESNYTRLLDK